MKQRFNFAQGFEGSHFSFNFKPLIGLSANNCENGSAVSRAYTDAIIDSGGIPFIIPLCNTCDFSHYVSMLDGLVLTGGADIEAAYFGEQPLPNGLTQVDPERDEYELRLLRAAYDRGLPILGICRGMQLINIAFGGNIYQDLPTQFKGTLLNHKVLEPKDATSHNINILKSSQLYTIIGSCPDGVNSRHHQAVRDVAPGFRAVAHSSDGVIEAIEAYPTRRIIGVQWHPENMATTGGSEPMKKLFEFFTSEALLFADAKDLHLESMIVDSHVDTAMELAKNDISLCYRSNKVKVDWAKLQEGIVNNIFMVAYIPQGINSNEGFLGAKTFAISTLENLKNEVLNAGGTVEPDCCFLDDKVVYLALENGYALGTDLNNVDEFKRLGVRYITLCHNGDNQLCGSAKGDGAHLGLTALGRKVVGRMNKLGVMVDVSHASEATFYDVLECSKKPVVASHSSCRALCDNPRNLSDEQIVALSKKQGVIQICLYKYFLREDGKATILDAVDHIEHVINLVGYDFVGVGSDFDGDGGIDGCNSINEFINLTIELRRRGHSREGVAKVMGLNFLNALEKVTN